MTATYAESTPIPTEAPTVRHRIKGMKSEITVDHLIKLRLSDAASPTSVYAVSSI